MGARVPKARLRPPWEALLAIEPVHRKTLPSQQDMQAPVSVDAAFDLATLYFRITTAHGVARTAKITIYGWPIP